jgi:hypothetical protein
MSGAVRGSSLPFGHQLVPSCLAPFCDAILATCASSPAAATRPATGHNGGRHVGPSTFKAKADALAWLATIEADIRRGAWIDPAG